MHSYLPCRFVSILSSLNSPIQDVHNIIVHGARKPGTAPAISHDNFHRVHGAQVAVLCGTCRKPVLTRRKPVETRSAIRTDHVSHVLEKV